MKLDDGKPWFRRWMWIGRKPITPEGKLTVALTFAICIPTALTSVALTDDHPLLAAVFGAIFIVAAIAGNAIILWKTDDPS